VPLGSSHWSMVQATSSSHTTSSAPAKHHPSRHSIVPLQASPSSHSPLGGHGPSAPEGIIASGWAASGVEGVASGDWIAASGTKIGSSQPEQPPAMNVPPSASTQSVRIVPPFTLYGITLVSLNPPR